MPIKRSAPSWLSSLLILQSLTLVGLLSLSRLPHFVRVVGRDLHPSVTNLSEAASLIIAISLIFIARGIRYRRQRAWFLATALQGALIVIEIFQIIYRFFSTRFDLHPIPGAVGITHLLFEVVLLSFLLIYRKRFNTVTDPHTRRSDFFYFIQVSGISLLVGALLVFIDSRHFLVRPSIFQTVEIALKGFLGISGPVPFSSPKYQARLEDELIYLGAFIAATTVIKFLRPVEVRIKQSLAERTKLRQLLDSYPSEDSLSYFSLRDDKSLIWATNQKAAIAYSVTRGTMIASGDPLGDPECWPSAISNFMIEAERHAWTPAVYGCSEFAGEIWSRETHFEALEIGDEAIVLTQDYNIETPQLKNVRQTLNRARKEELVAYTARISELSTENLENFVHLADAWRRGGDERGFSMALGRFCSQEDGDAVITWAERSGEKVGLLQFVPWGKDGLSLDLMRRAPRSSPGINELLIHTTIEYARAHEISKLSLNFATFRSIFERGERLGAGPITRFNHKVLIFASRFVQMESLYRFNAKFQPIWEPRFLLFPSVGRLGKIAFAVLRIESVLPDSPFEKLRKRRNLLNSKHLTQ